MPNLIDQTADIGRRTVDAIENFGHFVGFAGRTANWMFTGWRKWCRRDLMIPQLYEIGTLSVPVIAILGIFIGMVLSIEAYDQFAALGQEQRLGGVINISVVKQIGPVLAAVMIAGRVGGSISAELGTMRVTEQLDALRVMGADPVGHLVVPRVIACLIMTPILTIFADLMGILGGYLITVQFYGVQAQGYWDFSARFVTSWDIFTGLSKSVVFGLSLGLISCYKGFYCRRGAAGVGQAATDAFVTSFITIIIANLFLAKAFKELYDVIFGHTGMSAFSG
ncbi:MAG: ABC transporter permease [Phycisphaeraceae bacterium]|nr:ABC transporter permease [Phycisphaeraceae bacterium]